MLKRICLFPSITILEQKSEDFDAQKQARTIETQRKPHRHYPESFPFASWTSHRVSGASPKSPFEATARFFPFLLVAAETCSVQHLKHQLRDRDGDFIGRRRNSPCIMSQRWSCCRSYCGMSTNSSHLNKGSMSHVMFMFAVSLLRRGAIDQWSCRLARCVSTKRRLQAWFFDGKRDLPMPSWIRGLSTSSPSNVICSM